MKMTKSPGALLLLAKKPKGEEEPDVESEGVEDEGTQDDVKADAGSQLLEAFDSGNGEAVYEAVRKIIALERK